MQAFLVKIVSQKMHLTEVYQEVHQLVILTDLEKLGIFKDIGLLLK